MTAWWCQQGANYVLIETDSAEDVIRQAPYALIGRRVSWLYAAEVRRAEQTRGPVTVRTATPADLAVWADHLASLDDTPAPAAHDEPML